MNESRDLLVKYTDVLNRFGLNSEAEWNFLKEHVNDDEFIELAETTRKLKSELTKTPITRPVPEPEVPA